MHPFLTSLIGGAFIGLGAVLLMYSTKRIAGISSITGDLFTKDGIKEGWRYLWLAGLIAGPLVLWLITGNNGIGAPIASITTLAIAGVFVGIGTTLGSGCTSGHGVCGLARLSPRSLVAVLTFISFGILTVLVTK